MPVRCDLPIAFYPEKCYNTTKYNKENIIMPYPYSLDDEIKQYKPTPLQTDRQAWKLILFSILTLGIYSILFFMPFSYDIDKAAPRPDRSRTMSYAFAYILSLFTFSIVLLVWQYQIASRLEEALAEREIEYGFSTSDFWLWQVVGSFFVIGPFVYFHKLCKAMNLLCADYNKRNGI